MYRPGIGSASSRIGPMVRLTDANVAVSTPPVSGSCSVSTRMRRVAPVNSTSTSSTPSRSIGHRQEPGQPILER